MTCPMEEAVLHLQVQGLRAGMPTSPTSTHTMGVTHYRAGEHSNNTNQTGIHADWCYEQGFSYIL